jgi:hypothetical protein
VAQAMTPQTLAKIMFAWTIGALALCTLLIILS